ncbi:unknown [Ruminococcus sp. CAG:254]|nr:unknown [Ruminococcus sp. CAG:254]
MFFLIASCFVCANAANFFFSHQAVRVKSRIMQRQRTIADVLQVDTANSADSIREELFANRLCNAKGFKNLRALIRLDGGNTHLRGNLYDTADNCLNVCLACLRIILIQFAGVGHFIQGIQCQIRIDCTCTKPKQGCKVMDFGRFCSFYNQGNSGILSGAYQIGFQCGNCQQRRNCKVFLIHATVCQNQNRCSGIVCSICLCIQIGNGICQ